MKLKFLLAFPLIASSFVMGQTLPELKKIKGPEASAIDKVIDVPVSMYSGVASTSIPLYEINLKDVSIPISLSYVGGGGIKVDEEGTMVGLGWKLNYGSSISRNLQGKPDEWAFFGKQTISDFLQLPSYGDDPSQAATTNMMYEVKRNNGAIDLEPDEFYYSAEGYSGKFMYKQSTSSFVLFPKEDIKLTHQILAGSSPKRIQSWDLITPNGNKYTYGMDAISKSSPVNTPSLPPFSGALVYTTDNMWSLKKVTAINGESIDYYYTPTTYLTYSRSTNESYNVSYSTLEYLPARATTELTEPLISSISFPGGTVTFSFSSRLDHSTKKLDEIVVRNSANAVIKKIRFSYTYFYGNHGYVPANYRINTTDDLDNKRLRLDSVSIVGDNDAVVQVYDFDYYTGSQLPSKYSFAQDVWGYYNGANNTTWVPKYSTVPNGANRRVNTAVSNVFALKSVTYPTGGKTEFTYENNQVKLGPFSEFNNFLNDTYFNAQTVKLTIGTLTPNEISASGEYRYFKPFTVPAGGGYPTQLGWSGTFGASIGNAPSSACNNNYAFFKLEKLNSDNTYTAIENYQYCNGINPPVKTVPMKWLQPGNYRLVILTNFAPILTQNGSLSGLTTQITWNNKYVPNVNTNASMYVGGLRIKEISNYTSAGVLATRKIYDYSDSSGYSSGKIYEEPKFIGIQWLSGTAPNGNQINGAMLKIFGSPTRPLKPISGSYIGYEQVAEKLVDITTPTNTLITQYSYSYKPPIYDGYAAPSVFLDGTVENHDWQFGKLLSVKYYNQSNIIKQEDYTYNGMYIMLNDEFVDEIMARHISWSSLNLTANFSSDLTDFTDNYLFEGYFPLGPVQYAHFIYGIKALPNVGYPYTPQSQYFGQMTLPYTKHFTTSDKVASKTTTFFENGSSIQQVENYSYEGMPTHNQLTKSQTTNSENKVIRQQFLYPSDFSSDPLYAKMVQLNMKNSIIKQESYTDNVLLNSLKTNYYEWYTNMIAPSKVETQKSGAATDIRFFYNNYDKFGNVLCANPSGATSTCYVYAYSNQYPIAEIKNADYASVRSALGGDLAISNFSALVNPTDAQVNTFLAPLRTSTLLTNALVTTYTYKPLAGITSMTDAKGITNYYTYDNMQRLQSVKDELSRYLQEFNYRLRD